MSTLYVPHYSQDSSQRYNFKEHLSFKNFEGHDGSGATSRVHLASKLKSRLHTTYGKMIFSIV